MDAAHGLRAGGTQAELHSGLHRAIGGRPMKRSIIVVAATAIGVALCPAVAIAVPAGAVSTPATTTAVTLNPAAGPPTTAASVKGTGFGPGETVNVDFDTAQAGTAVTSAAGSFSAVVRVPAAALPGRHTVTATGQASHLAATAFFWVRTNWARFHRTDSNSGYNPY